GGRNPPRQPGPNTRRSAVAFGGGRKNGVPPVRRRWGRGYPGRRRWGRVAAGAADSAWPASGRPRKRACRSAARGADQLLHFPHGVLEADEQRMGDDGVADVQFVEDRKSTR